MTEPGLRCPKCGEFAGQYLRDVLNKHHHARRRTEIDKKHLNIQPPRNGTKHVYCYLLVDPNWLQGSRGTNSTAKSMADMPMRPPKPRIAGMSNALRTCD